MRIDQQAGLHVAFSAQRSSAAQCLATMSGRMPRAEQGCLWLRRSLTRLFKGRFEVRLPRTWGGVFRNDYDHRDFCAIGASAGAQRFILYLLRSVFPHALSGWQCVPPQTNPS